jgi:hypothetical protein
MFLAVAARGPAEFPPKKAGEAKLVIEPAGFGDF